MTDSIIVATVAASVPTIAVLIGILLNHNHANRLDTRIGQTESALRAEIAAARGELQANILAARLELHNDIGELVR